MDRLERECRCFALYLTGQPASDYLVLKYKDFHDSSPEVANSDSFDEFLIERAVRGPFWTRLADCYASRFRKTSAIRKKLVLTLAILECSSASSQRLDSIEHPGMAGAVWRLTLIGARYAGCLALSALLFTPARIRLWLARRSHQRAVAEGRWIL
jgi:hypothetical protein